MSVCVFCLLSRKKKKKKKNMLRVDLISDIKSGQISKERGELSHNNKIKIKINSGSNNERGGVRDGETRRPHVRENYCIGFFSREPWSTVNPGDMIDESSFNSPPPPFAFAFVSVLQLTS